MQQPGRLIILNGVSSSGKTTLATGFRDQRADDGELWLLMGIDDYLSKLPAQWLDLGLADGRGRWASDGLSFVHTSSGTALRIGSVCRAILRAYQRSVGAAVRSGFDVIVDEVVVDETAWTDWCDVLEGLDAIWVAVRCAPAVVSARELARGDRPVGMASTQFDVVHRYPNYAFEIDTTDSGPSDALQQFCASLNR